MRKESPFALDFNREECTTFFAPSRNDSSRFSFPKVNQSRYKIVFELNRLECRDYFEFCNNNTRSNNPFKICKKSAKVNAFKHSFFVRIIKEWNNLPHHLFGNDININKFKYNLKKWMNISSRIYPLLLV